MEKTRFKYKPSGVDQMIMGIILLSLAAFGALIYFDSTNKLPTNTDNSSPEVQNLLQAQQQLEAEIERIKNETNTN